jgi:hypothetical protein
MIYAIVIFVALIVGLYAECRRVAKLERLAEERVRMEEAKRNLAWYLNRSTNWN